MTDQTLEEAQDTNRRMNRRLGATEAPLHSLVSRAFDQVQATQELLARAQAEVRMNHITMEYLREEINKYRNQIDARQRGTVFLWGWALVATAGVAFTLWHG